MSFTPRTDSPRITVGPFEFCVAAGNDLAFSNQPTALAVYVRSAGSTADIWEQVGDAIYDPLPPIVDELMLEGTVMPYIRQQVAARINGYLNNGRADGIPQTVGDWQASLTKHLSLTELGGVVEVSIG
jgi:hypothetical protein